MRARGVSVVASTLRAVSVLVVLRWIAPGLFLICVAVVAAVGIVSWGRTAPIRRGRGPPRRRPLPVAQASRTSRASFVPGLAGTAALAWSETAQFGPPALQIVLALGGALVAVSGFTARVASLDVAGGGLTVRYTARPPFKVSWSDLRELRPPRWPLGGWRLIGEARSRTLMPSDLLGQEGVLDAMIDRAGLRFGEGAWIRVCKPAQVSRTA